MKKKLTQKLVAAAMLAAMLLLSAQLTFANGPAPAGGGSSDGVTTDGKLSWNT
jgi:hypothetical protein